MSDENLKPIIVKRIKKSGGGHHGGAWKIAYADFVTAMMAFFLLMWLLGSTAKGDLSGIAEYFQTPLKIAMLGGSGSGDASSLVPGGGKDLAQKVGQIKRADDAARKKIYDKQAAKAVMAEMARSENARLRALKARVEAAIQSSTILRQHKDQLLLDITPEGLRIQLVDKKNRPMFALASANLQAYTKDVLHEIGMVLNEVPNRVGLSGHTDALPYTNGDNGYSNWELSADRANASRRELITGGLDENKILRVIGLADSAHIDRKDPFNPINRRISIVVLNKHTEDQIVSEGQTLDVKVE